MAGVGSVTGAVVVSLVVSFGLLLHDVTAMPPDNRIPTIKTLKLSRFIVFV